MPASPQILMVPRLLSAPLAAAYIGISPRSFDKLWRAAKLPHPIKIGRRLLWDRKVLDVHFDGVS